MTGERANLSTSDERRSRLEIVAACRASIATYGYSNLPSITQCESLLKVFSCVNVHISRS